MKLLFLFVVYSVSLQITYGGEIESEPLACVVATVGNKRARLPIDELDVELRHVGHELSTCVTLSVRNAHPHDLFSVFRFQIPADAAIMDVSHAVDGVMINGRIIEKKVAVRRKRVWVDDFAGKVRSLKGKRTTYEYAPDVLGSGLLITAGKSIRFRIRWVETQKGTMYALPLQLLDPVDKFSLAVSSNAPTHPEIIGDLPAKWTVDASNDARTYRSNAMMTLPKNVTLEFPLTKTTCLGKAFGERILSFSKEIPSRSITPRRIRIYWDTSASQLLADRKRALAFLAELLRRRETVSVELIPFGTVPEAKQSFRCGNGEWTDLRHALESIRHDGGSKLKFLTNDSFNDVDTVFLFTDARTSDAPDLTLPSALTGKLFIVGSSEFSRMSTIHDLISRGRGTYLDLAVGTLEKHVKTVLDWNPCTAIAGKTSTPLEMTWSMAGESTVFRVRVPDACRRVTLVRSRTGETVAEHDLDQCASHPVPEWSAALFAWGRVETMSLQTKRDLSESRELGIKYQVLTPGTRFFVCRSLDDFITQGVRPPKGLDEMRVLYDGLREFPGETIEVARVPKVVAPDFEAWSRLVKYSRSREGPLMAKDVWGSCTSVNRRLPWLASVQNHNGSWGSENVRLGTTGLALSPYLFAGKTPLDDRVGKTIQNGMRFLASELMDRPSTELKNRGGLQAIHSLALSYSLTRIPFLKKPLDAARSSLIKHQLPDGGFSLTRNALQGSLADSYWYALALSEYEPADADETVTSAKKKLHQFFLDRLRREDFSYKDSHHAFRSPAVLLSGLTLTGSGNVYDTQEGRVLWRSTVMNALELGHSLRKQPEMTGTQALNAFIHGTCFKKPAARKYVDAYYRILAVLKSKRREDESVQCDTIWGHSRGHSENRIITTALVDSALSQYQRFSFRIKMNPPKLQDSLMKDLLTYSSSHNHNDDYPNPNQLEPQERESLAQALHDLKPFQKHGHGEFYDRMKLASDDRLFAVYDELLLTAPASVAVRLAMMERLIHVDRWDAARTVFSSIGELHERPWATYFPLYCEAVGKEKRAFDYLSELKDTDVPALFHFARLSTQITLASKAKRPTTLKTAVDAWTRFIRTNPTRDGVAYATMELSRLFHRFENEVQWPADLEMSHVTPEFDVRIVVHDLTPPNAHAAASISLTIPVSDALEPLVESRWRTSHKGPRRHTVFGSVIYYVNHRPKGEDLLLNVEEIYGGGQANVHPKRFLIEVTRDLGRRTEFTRRIHLSLTPDGKKRSKPINGVMVRLLSKRWVRRHLKGKEESW